MKQAKHFFYLLIFIFQAQCRKESSHSPQPNTPNNENPGPVSSKTLSPSSDTTDSSSPSPRDPQTTYSHGELPDPVPSVVSGERSKTHLPLQQNTGDVQPSVAQPPTPIGQEPPLGHTVGISEMETAALDLAVKSLEFPWSMPFSVKGADVRPTTNPLTVDTESNRAAELLYPGVEAYTIEFYNPHSHYNFLFGKASMP